MASFYPGMFLFTSDKRSYSLTLFIFFLLVLMLSVPLLVQEMALNGIRPKTLSTGTLHLKKWSTMYGRDLLPYSCSSSKDIWMTHELC